MLAFGRRKCNIYDTKLNLWLNHRSSRRKFMSDTSKPTNQLIEENKVLKAELQQLKRQNQILSQITNAPNILAWMVNTKFEFIHLSPAFIGEYHKLTGQKPELYSNAIDYFESKRKCIWQDYLNKALDGKSFEVEEFIGRYDGDKYFKINLSPVTIEHQTIGVLAVINEITGLKNAEKKELATLIKLREIFNHIEDLYFETDLDGKIVDISPAVETLLNYSRENLINKNATVLYQNKSDRQEFIKILKEKGIIKNYPIQLKRKDGKPKTYSVNASIIRNQHNSPIKIVGIIRDLTEIEKINKDLRWLRSAIEQSPMSIVITDVDGNIEYTNPFFTTMTGYSKIEVISKKPSVLKSGRHPKSFYKDLWQTIQQGQTWRGEFYNKRKDGRIYTEKAIISPVKNKEGKITNFIAIKEDITIVKQTKEEIRQLRSFNDRIINTMNEGILVENADGEITFINPAFSKMTDFSGEALIRKSWKVVIEKKFHDRFLNFKKQTKDGPKNYIEARLKCKNGSYMPVIVGGSPIMDGRKIMGMITVYTDIAELKEKEEKLKKALEKAQLSDKLKSSFLANMSHEIRTPMNAIIGFTDILRQEKDLDNETREEYFSIIEKKGNELLQIISDLIDVSKIETKVVDLHPQKIEVNKFLRDAFLSFKKELSISQKSHLGIELKIPENSDSLCITADSFRLRQILTNLLDNAQKFTKEGQITIGYSKKNKLIEFFVGDTGIGISKSDQEIIFDRFRQADNNYTRQFRGTGLGLHICKNLVELMGGSISVESEINQGTTFYIAFPL